MQAFGAFLAALAVFALILGAVAFGVWGALWLVVHWIAGEL